MQKKLVYRTLDSVAISNPVWINSKKCTIIMHLNENKFEIIEVVSGQVIASSDSMGMKCSSRSVLNRQCKKALKKLKGE